MDGEDGVDANYEEDLSKYARAESEEEGDYDAVEEPPPPDESANGVDSRPIEEQLEDAKKRIEKLTADLLAARNESKTHKHEAETYKRRLKECLWDYIPRQRKVIDIPAVDPRAWVDEATLQLQNFQVTHFIGAGHFGSVHAGVARETDDPVAIKVIAKDNVMTLVDMIGVEQEIRALKCLSQHPNIVRLVEVINAPSHIVIVTPYMTRGNLYQFMVEYDHIPDSELRRMMTAITSAVNYIHMRNFCHRDLKPENILLDDQRNPVLIDFGLSCKVNPGQAFKSLCGTDGFIAPEMRSGKPYQPKPCDMFAVGGILLELAMARDTIDLLRGIDPLNAAEKLAKTFGVVTDSGRTPECQGLLHELLTDDTKKRITAARVLQHPFLTGEASAETTTPKTSNSSPPIGRRLPKTASQPPISFPSSSNGSQSVAAAATQRERETAGMLHRPRSSTNILSPNSSSVRGGGMPGMQRPETFDATPQPPSDGGPMGRSAKVQVLNESELMQSLMAVNMGMGSKTTGRYGLPEHMGHSSHHGATGAGNMNRHGSEIPGLPYIDR